MGLRKSTSGSAKTLPFFSSKKNNGQAVLEMVLILPILLVLVVGALELGRVYFAKIVIKNAAREGAYYLSSHPTDITATNCAESAHIFPGYACTRLAAQDEANSSGLTLSDLDITVTSCCTSGQPVIVNVTTPVQGLFILELLNNGVDVKRPECPPDVEKGTKCPLTISTFVEMVVQ
jgi:Flp pilus assembly protein TadG